MSTTRKPGLDLLAIGAHPDDVELFAGGTIARLVSKGCRIGLLDLTRGESATCGTTELRMEEARAAAGILGIPDREGLDLGDGDLVNSQVNRGLVVDVLRRLQPRVVMTHHPEDRHPDHRRANELVGDAVFFCNVGKFPAEGERWQVEAVCYFHGNTFKSRPDADWVVDISDYLENKKEVLKVYRSQFLADLDDPDSTYIASRSFWEHMERRSRDWGHRIGVEAGEPFSLDTPAHAGHPFIWLFS
jgi:bacillithiol biosynthesis deacetylase BshB1